MTTQDRHPWELVVPLYSGYKEGVFSILGFLLALDVFLRFSPVFLAVMVEEEGGTEKEWSQSREDSRGALNESQPDGNSGVDALANLACSLPPSCATLG